MIPERISCAIGVSFSSFETVSLLFVSEEFDICHSLKLTPVKTFLNCIATKSTGTMQTLCSANISTHNLPML